MLTVSSVFYFICVRQLSPLRRFRHYFKRLITRTRGQNNPRICFIGSCSCPFTVSPLPSSSHHVSNADIVWRIKDKIIKTVLCCLVYDSCTQWYAHTYEKMSVGLGLGLVFVHLFRVNILRVFSGFHLVLVLSFLVLGLSFFGTTPIG